MAEQGPLTVEQEAELAELRPKAQQWQKPKDGHADWYGAGKTAAACVAVLEELAGRGPLTVEQEAELAELRPKAQWQKRVLTLAGKVAADRVVELEALKEQGPLTEEQEVELAELQTKVAQQWQKQKERNAKRYRAGKAAAARVAELKGREGLAEEQVAELAELRPKAQQWQKENERLAEWHRARMSAARVAMLEALKEQGRLTDEQEAELAELAARGRKKQDQDVTETGVGGPVTDRGAGPAGVSGWTWADQDDWDGWSADVDLDAWFARAVADVDGALVPQGPRMLG